MAHLTAIFRPSCVKCEELAEYELRTSRNEMKGTFCKHHGEIAMRQLHEAEPPLKRMVGADRVAP